MLGGSRSIAPDAVELEALETGGVAGAALERLAFTSSRHGCVPSRRPSTASATSPPSPTAWRRASARRSVSLCGTAAMAHTTPRCCRPRRTRTSSTSSLAATTTAATALGGAGTSYSARAGRRSTICWARTPRTRTSSSLRSTTLQRPLHASSASRWCHRLQRVRPTKAATAAVAALAGTLKLRRHRHSCRCGRAAPSAGSCSATAATPSSYSGALRTPPSTQAATAGTLRRRCALSSMANATATRSETARARRPRGWARCAAWRHCGEAQLPTPTRPRRAAGAPRPVR